ncbi:MAG: zinc ribbon domain-containing protein [Candidatus Caldatribacteriaceae bacterium]
MSDHGNLDLLLHLQDLDREIRVLQSKIEKREKEIHHLEEIAEQAQREIESMKKTLEKAKVSLSYKELELKDTEEKLKTTKGKLYSGEITSAKELSQWEKSMEKLEEAKNALEEEILLDMEKMEILQKEFQTKSQSTTLQLEKNTQTIQSFQKEIETWKETLKTLYTGRQTLLSQVESHVLSVYLELQKKYENPVVPLNDETCNGCHLVVPTTVTKSVRRQKELTRCPNCGRFLYYKVP